MVMTFSMPCGSGKQLYTIIKFDQIVLVRQEKLNSKTIAQERY